MRLWGVDPTKLCTQHLLGEHVETHMFAGCLIRNKNLSGYVNTGLVDLSMLKTRHDILAEELLRRGYNHNSQYPTIELPSLGYIDIVANEAELRRRCRKCFREEE